MYSALKVGGKKLYELAREGKTVERKARPVQIHSIEIMEIDLPRVTMEVSCSKGTYIRTLCHDIGEKLGCGACMESLLRTKVSRFELEDSLTLGEIEKKKQDGTLMEAIIPIDAMFPECRSVDVKEAGNQYLYNGNPFSLSFVKKREKYEPEERVRVYDAQGVFVGIYRYRQEEKMFRLEKMFYEK